MAKSLAPLNVKGHGSVLQLLIKAVNFSDTKGKLYFVHVELPLRIELKHAHFSIRGTARMYSMRP